MKFLLNWGPYSLWVFNFGLACCSIEFIAASTSKHDFIRFGHPGRARTPAGGPDRDRRDTDRQDDAGDQAPVRPDAGAQVRDLDGIVRQLRPLLGLYSVTKGIDQVLPVDVYVPGCPPRPEALLQGIIRLQRRSPPRTSGRSGVASSDTRFHLLRSNRACVRNSVTTCCPSRTSTGTASSR